MAKQPTWPLPLVLAIAILCISQVAFPAQAALAAGPTRRLHLSQELDSDAVVAGIRVADFSTLPENLTAQVEYAVPEIQLNGKVPITSNSSGDENSLHAYGTFMLGPAEVQSLAQSISTELMAIPASQAVKTAPIAFPGVAIRGESVLDTLSTQQPLRIPTVFAPFYAGTVFTVDGREAPPGVTLQFSNMTLLLPNVTYDGIYESGLMDYFDLGASARFCFTNSILALQSCEGFPPDTYHMWCCTERQCNILYTQQAIKDLGYDTIDNLELIQCVAGEDTEDPAPAGSEAVTVPEDAEQAAVLTAHPPLHVTHPVYCTSSSSTIRKYTVQETSQQETSQPEQEAGSTTVRVADFTGLPANVSASLVYNVPETELPGQVSIGNNSGRTALYGTYALGSDEVTLLAQTISTNLVPVPPEDAVKTPLIQFPGVAIRGESALDTLSKSQPLRIPTVFAPFYAGTVFTVDGRDAPPGVTLQFSNMTLLLPNVTYEGIYESGLMDFFDLGAFARFCFTNSILALQSCEGFPPDTYHMWCCTERQCNILYTQQALADLGYDTIDDLELIQCVATEGLSSGDDVVLLEAAAGAAVRAVHAVLWASAGLAMLAFTVQMGML